MQQWRDANKNLAAASDEKARIRGTQQTDNPLMKDMRSRLPMNSPSVQSPDVAKLGAGNQSLTQNPNAFKAATPAPSSPSPSTASTGFKLAKQGVDLSKTNKQKINAGMEIQGDKLQEELKGDGYGGSARPDSLLDAYQSIYKS
jgi:hypothetical protein